MSFETTPDLGALQTYVESLGLELGELKKIEKFSGGQSNPTFKVTTTSETLVLRRQPLGKLLKSAHAVDREYRIIDALQETDVPVPKAMHLCTDSNVIGSQFYLMSFIEGAIYWDASLKKLGSDNTARAEIYDQMNLALTKLHQVKAENVGLTDFGKPGNYFARQLDRWTKQYHASKTEENPDADQLIKWLEDNLVDDDGKTAIVHGDFRLDNMVFDSKKHSLLAILDWELSTLGHPYADLAYQCMQLRLPANMGNVPGLGGVNRAELGIMSEKQYLQKYCERMGIDGIPNWQFYIVFSFFRLFSIVQGVVKRAKDGNASNPKALELESLLKPLSQLALSATTEGK